MEKIEICVLCGQPIIGYGNNPWPLAEEGRCCDECNELVIMARIGNLIKKKEESEGATK